MKTGILIAVALALIFAGVLVRKLGLQKRKTTGVYGDVYYSDADHLRAPGVLKYKEGEIMLVGKPDYVVKEGEDFIPVEYKSGKSPTHLYKSYRYQVVLYSLLIQGKYGRRPGWGKVRFKDGKEFRVDIDEQILSEVRNLLKTVAEAKMSRKSVRRNHEDSNKCSSCEFFAICEQKLN